MRQIILPVLLLMRCFSALAQVPVAEMQLPEVNSDGFYRIEIPVEYGGFFTPSFSNVRISDGSQHDVPYIPGQAIEEFQSQFKPYEIISKEQRKGCCTQLIFRADGQINNIQLRIRNAETSKRASLLGSDDRNTWFALKEKFSLSWVDGKDNTFEIRIIDFPLSNYNYYKIEIDDSLTAPLNILEVGSYSHPSRRRTLLPLADPSIEVKREGTQETRIALQWDTLQRIDRLNIHASGPPLFRRHGLLYAISKVGDSGKKDKRNLIGSVELSSGKAAEIDLPLTYASNLELVIDDGDSPPLKIDAVKAYQVQRFLIAWLEGGKSYNVLVHDKSMRAPVYDLELFRDQVPEETAVIKPAELVKPVRVQSGDDPFFSSGAMWAAIILIIGILAFYSYRMVQHSS